MPADPSHAVAGTAGRRLLAAPLVCGLLTALDAAPAGLAAAVCAGGLGLLIGALAGGLWAGLGAAFSRLPRALGWLPWLGFGAALGWWLVDGLGALGRLGGAQHTLAVLALVGGALVALAVGATLAGLQPGPGAPDGWLGQGRRRIALWVILPLAALAAAWIDRTRFIGLYPEAHTTLRLITLGALAASVGLIRRPPLPPRAAVVIGALALALAALPFFTLHRGADATLERLVARPLPGMMLDGARALTDVDLDGASSLLGGGDGQPFDPPEASAGDDDRRGASPGPSLSWMDPGERGAPPVSVVLITIDTLRPDRMSLYGHDRPTTPRIDAFARGALRFDRAVSPGGWTSLAISSLMRGRAPRRLRWTKVVETSSYRLVRWRDRATIDRTERLRMMFGLPLDDPHPTLAERLAHRGVHTMAVVDDGYSQFLSSAMGADRGFAEFRSVDALPKPQRTDRGTTDLALALLDERPRDTGFFLWVHYFGPHDPSVRRAGAPWYGEGVADAYDHEIAFVDQQVGRLLDRIDELGADRPVAVILTSDHGELFYEKRRMHGLALQPSVVRVPLLVKAPGLAPGSTDALAGLLDIYPTVLGLTETRARQPLDGIDLRTVAAEAPARILTSDTWRHDRNGKAVYDQVAATDGRHLLRLDRVRNLRALWAFDDASTAPADLRGTVDAARLEAGLDDYLDATGGGRVILVE